MDFLTDMRDPSEKSSSYFGNKIVNDLLDDEEPSISAIHSNGRPVQNTSFESIENEKMMIQTNKRGQTNSLDRFPTQQSEQQFQMQHPT